MPECMICGRRVGGDCWLCCYCEHGYPALARTYRQWPAWAKFMREEEQRRRRRMYYQVQIITCADSAAVDRLLYGD